MLEVFKVNVCSLKLSFLCRRSLRETKPSMIRREEEWQLEKRSKVEKFSPNEPSPGRVGRWFFSVVTSNLKRKSDIIEVEKKKVIFLKLDHFHH